MKNCKSLHKYFAGVHLYCLCNCLNLLFVAHFFSVQVSSFDAIAKKCLLIFLKLIFTLISNPVLLLIIVFDIIIIYCITIGG